MENHSALNTIKEIISEVTGLMPEEISDDAALVQDIGLSSFEIMYLLNELGKKFQKEILIQEFREAGSVRELANIVSEHQK